MENMNITEVSEYIRSSSKESRIYIGSDSTRFKRLNRDTGIKEWWSEYCTVVVIHIDSKRGCKIFSKRVIERDYDAKASKPRMRLLNEVTKSIDLYTELSECIGTRHTEIHIDVNPDEKFGSSCVINEALGYVRSMTPVDAKCKPAGWAASIAADRFLS